MSYPSPCKSCQRESCRGVACADWQIRYRVRQKQINIKALQIARGEATEKTSVWVYMHPDEYRRYLENNPCEKCFAKELCDTPCQRYLLWYNDRMALARKKAADA